MADTANRANPSTKQPLHTAYIEIEEDVCAAKNAAICLMHYEGGLMKEDGNAIGWLACQIFDAIAEIQVKLGEEKTA